MKIVERVFLGFQFESEFYDRSTIETLLVESVEQASKEIKKSGLNYVNLDIQLIELKPGEGVTDGIIRLLDESLLCLFEISDNNPNVMFELGNAYAKNKGLILLKHRNSVSLNKVPSDILGKFILYYGGTDYPSIEKIRPKITKGIKEYVIEVYNKKLETWKRKIWDLNGDNLIVVSGNLFGRYEVEPKDADSLFDTTLGLMNLYPGINVKRLYSIDFTEKDFVDHDLLVIGGPDSNLITKKILDEIDQSFPFIYEEIDEPFDFVLKDKCSSKKYKKEFEGTEVKTDYGFFLKIPNPYTKNRNIIIITGIGAEGTYGCSKSLPFESNEFTYSYYNDKFSKLGNIRYFSFITKAIIDNSQIKGQIVEDTFYYLDQRGNQWGILKAISN